MPGIIEGYNYDVFISHRHKDNKRDGYLNLNKFDLHYIYLITLN